MKRVIIGDDDRAPCARRPSCRGGIRFAFRRNSADPRQEHPQAVLDRDAGRDDQESVREQLGAGAPRELTACQAISIAMTVVLPLPVAILKASG